MLDDITLDQKSAEGNYHLMYFGGYNWGVFDTDICQWRTLTVVVHLRNFKGEYESNNPARIGGVIVLLHTTF